MLVSFKLCFSGILVKLMIRVTTPYTSLYHSVLILWVQPVVFIELFFGCSNTHHYICAVFSHVFISMIYILSSYWALKSKHQGLVPSSLDGILVKWFGEGMFSEEHQGIRTWESSSARTCQSRYLGSLWSSAYQEKYMTCTLHSSAFLCRLVHLRKEHKRRNKLSVDWNLHQQLRKYLCIYLDFPRYAIEGNREGRA